jgi:hypothetical protein
MSIYKKLNFDRVKTYSLKDRKSNVNTGIFARVVGKDESLENFLSSLPDVLVAKDFKDFVVKYRKASDFGRARIWMMGAHVIKCGLNPLMIRLMETKSITHLAVNGACVIHDVELAIQGSTSEDVAAGLLDGTFGMAKDTATFINDCLTAEMGNTKGYGEIIGNKINLENLKFKNLSLLATAVKKKIPISVHPALGTEIVHQHPNLDWKALGEKSLLDFKLFVHSLSTLTTDAIVVNVGSAVIMPEVFLKALTVVRNLGYPAFGFHSAVFDMIKHYRPQVNVQNRPTEGKGNGKGYYFVGHHEIQLPLLISLIIG